MCTEQDAQLAVHYDTLRVLQWVHAQGGQLTPPCFRLAIKNENIPILDWLVENKCPQANSDGLEFISPEPIYRLKYIETYKWLIDHGMMSSRNSPYFDGTILGKNLDIVQMVESSCKLNKNIDRYTKLAATSGNLEILKYLITNGYKWCHDTYSAIINHCNEETKTWIEDYNGPQNFEGDRIIIWTTPGKKILNPHIFATI